MAHSIAVGLLLLACSVCVLCVLRERSTRTDTVQFLKRPRSEAVSRRRGWSWNNHNEAGRADRQRRQAEQCGLTAADVLDMEPVSY